MEELEEKQKINSTFNNVSGFKNDHEKLQQSHDLLLHQLEDSKLFIEKLKKDLAETTETKLTLLDQLKITQEELNDVRKQLNDVNDKIQKISDVEAKSEKMKMLAVKLKKNLSLVTEELEKSQNNEAQLREQVKLNNKDKISLLYQQTVKNYQTLQSEYDQVQDTCDQLKLEAKTVTTELTNTLNEMTKVKEDLANYQIMNDNLSSKVNLLMNNLTDQEKKTQDLEATIIILNNEIKEERKKNFIGIELEKSLEELKNQLDIKTNQVVDLEIKLDQLKQVEQNFEEIKLKLELCLNEKQAVSLTNKTLETSVADLEKKLKEMEGLIEENKIKLSEFFEKNNSLENNFKILEEQYSRKIKNSELELRKTKESLSLMEEELKQKDNKFESYKIRVYKLLNDKNKSNNDSEKVKEMEKKIELLVEEIENKDQELASINKIKDNFENELKAQNIKLKNALIELKKIETLNDDNLRLKTLARDLQNKIVEEREEAEKKIEQIEKNYTFEIEKLQSQIKNLKEEIFDFKENVSNLQEKDKLLSSDIENNLSIQIPSVSVLIQKTNRDSEFGEIESPNPDSLFLLPKANQSNISTPDDSSTNVLINPLQEILNLSNESQANSEIKQFKDLDELLKESESSNRLLTEQNLILKEEIRRLQRSIERVEMVKNMEYLKNIIVKFVSANCERIHLVPVLKTLLKLNKQEENLFLKFANNSTNVSLTNNQQERQSSSASNNWSNYLWNAFS